MEKHRPEYDLIVAGAGPAGSACAITAARGGARVLLVEKDRLPRHKVCGEFVSHESLRLLESLLSGEPFAAHPRVSGARIFLDHKIVSFPLPVAAWSISRYELDAALLDSARQVGVKVQEETTIRDVDQREAGSGFFRVNTSSESFTARAVVNATGRWSHLTRPSAPFGDSRWIGLKAHFRESGPSDSVDLYFFSGGYCGVQKVGDSAVNAAAMVRTAAARSMDEVLAAHPELWRRSRGWQPLFPAITTSPLYFRAPKPLDGGIVCAGDAAGFIDPFAGDGISLALHGGALAAEMLGGVFRNECSLAHALENYRAQYQRRFAPAFRNAARLRAVLAAPGWIRSGLMTLIKTRPIASLIVRGTRARVS